MIIQRYNASIRSISWKWSKVLSKVWLSLRYMVDNRRKASWSSIFSFFVAGVLLFLAFRGANWNEMANTVWRSQLDYMALAFMILSASYFVRSLRWRLLLSAEKIIAPFTVFWGTVVGYLGNSFLPARAGELIRSVMIGRSANISKSYVLATALTERITDAMILVLIGLVALISLERLPGWLLIAAQAMAVLGVVSLVGLFVISRLERFLRKALFWFPLPDGLRTRAVASLQEFLLGIRAFQHPGRALSFVGLTMVIWLMDAAMAIGVGRAMNLTLVLPQALILLTALGLASALPSTPGYVGIYQFVAVTILPIFSFSQSEALAYIIAFQAMSYSVVVLWGSVGLWRLGVATSDISATV